MGPGADGTASGSSVWVQRLGPDPCSSPPISDLWGGGVTLTPHFGHFANKVDGAPPQITYWL